MTAQNSPIRRRSALLIVALSLLTGLYPLIWYYRTWSEMRRTRRLTMVHPIFHLLGFFVPILSLYRVWKHAATVNAICTSEDAHRFGPWKALVGSMIAGGITGMALMTPGLPGIGLMLTGSIISAALLVRMQSLLNNYVPAATPLLSLVQFGDAGFAPTRLVLAGIAANGERREIDLTQFFAA